MRVAVRHALLYVSFSSFRGNRNPQAADLPIDNVKSPCHLVLLSENFIEPGPQSLEMAYNAAENMALPPQTSNAMQSAQSKYVRVWEVTIQDFLDKTKKKPTSSKDLHKEPDSPTEQQEKLRKKVTNLMKKQELHRVRSIVNEHDHGKPWGQEGQVKVGSRLIQLLMETAYIQSPADHSEDVPTST